MERRSRAARGEPDRPLRGAHQRPRRSFRHGDGTEILDRYEDLDTPARITFFEALAEKFGPDHDKLASIVEAWRREPSADLSADLHFLSEPRRQELFRRLNRAPGATAALVRMRADLIALARDHPALVPVDR